MLRLRYALTLILLIEISLKGYGQDNHSNINYNFPNSPEEIVVLDSAINLYQAGDFYISGQPDRVVLKKLANQNMGLVINIRTPEEMDGLKKDGFDEAAFLDSLNIPYINIPIGGKAGFTSKAIQEIDSVIKKYPQARIMIHCRSAARATNAWMAWLINYEDIPVNDAIDMGRKMQFSFILEDLLGYDLSFGQKQP